MKYYLLALFYFFCVGTSEAQATTPISAFTSGDMWSVDDEKTYNMYGAKNIKSPDKKDLGNRNLIQRIALYYGQEIVIKDSPGYSNTTDNGLTPIHPYHSKNKDPNKLKEFVVNSDKSPIIANGIVNAAQLYTPGINQKIQDLVGQATFSSTRFWEAGNAPDEKTFKETVKLVNAEITRHRNLFNKGEITKEQLNQVLGFFEQILKKGSKEVSTFFQDIEDIDKTTSVFGVYTLKEGTNPPDYQVFVYTAGRNTELSEMLRRIYKIKDSSNDDSDDSDDPLPKSSRHLK